MNSKTTILLATVLVGLLLGFFVVRARLQNQGDQNSEDAPGFVGRQSSVARPFVEQEVRTLSKLIYRAKGQDVDWVFECNTDVESDRFNKWEMTSPLRFDVPTWELDKITRRVLGAEYEVSHKIGGPGAITLADAGLEPPACTISLTDQSGTSLSIELGHPASLGSTYARLVGTDRICEIDLDLKGLAKSKAIEYRDPALWSIPAERIRKVNVVDRRGAEPVEYVLSRKGVEWVMEAPVAAKCTENVGQMVTSLGRLRAVKWHSQAEGNMAAYGLDPAAVTVQITAVEDVPVEGPTPDSESTGTDESDGDEKQAMVEVERTYVVHLASLSPIGEANQLYMRVGDEPMVATILRSSADKLMPALSEWRDMSLVTSDVQRATRIELAGADGRFALIKQDNLWVFEDDNRQLAEEQKVNRLLDTVRDLKALAFVDGPVTDWAPFGLDEPRALLHLTVPGLDGTETLAIGDYTDKQLKRLVYVRSNDSNTVGKVRSADVEPLLAGESAYRDHTVFDLAVRRIETLSVDRKNEYENGRLTVGFARDDEKLWKMVEPVEASVMRDNVEEMVADLSRLKAESILSRSDGLSQFGLDDPDVIVTFTYRPNPEYVVEPQEAEAAEEGDSPRKLSAREVEVPAETYELHVAMVDDVFYAKRGDDPVVFVLPARVARRFYSQLRDNRVLLFEKSDVSSFCIKADEVEHCFRRADGSWLCEQEPDWPLNDKKVDNLLLQVRDLRATAWVAYGVADTSSFGLDDLAYEATVRTKDGLEMTLMASRTPCRVDAGAGYYAAMKDGRDIFLLSDATLRRLDVDLDDLESD